MDKKPTFEDLVGNTDAQEWTNDVSDGELSIVSALANKQLEIAMEVAKLEADFLLNNSLDNEASFANDLLNSARNRINYRELAESYMEDYYGNQTSEEI